MIREIVEVTDEHYTIKFPQEFLGQKVEIIAFKIEETEDKAIEVLDREQKLQDIRERYGKYPRTSHENYKFDRDEANDFD